ncbi:MAG TPA: hypothetical protein VE961_06795 [Pyrinomonadaceae bacterium]|nr:hypothetical protein [Pyrinomonadaceae bacterium]
MSIGDAGFDHSPSGSLTGHDDPEGAEIAVLDWRAWDGFLLAHVLGEQAVRVETDPFREFPPAEFDRLCHAAGIVCFQINLSVRAQLPLRIRQLTRRFTERGVYVVNGHVQDIRKSTLHAHLEAIGLVSARAAASGPADEVLFVKTALNYGGELERWLPPEDIAAAGFADLISPDVGAYRYQAIERGRIEPKVWSDPAMVVEKYVTNSEGSFYRVYFSGRQIIIVKAFAPGTIKKLSGDSRDTNFVTSVEHLKAGTDHVELSASLRRDVATFVERTPVEFGCIDIVHDGADHHYVIDLNLTPYAGKRAHDPYLTNFLRQGITDPSRRKLNGYGHSPLAAYAALK